MISGNSIASGAFPATASPAARTHQASFGALARWFFTDGKKILLLFVLVFVAYRPLLPGTFLMDDRRLIEGSNPIVQGELTPRSVWFQTDFSLTTLAFWAQWKLWGTHPAGYHFVNLFLHGLSAVLIWRLGRNLKIPGSWLAGAIFAVHPVAVVSVGRIAELKNTLSLPFFLVSLLAYLRFDAYCQEASPGSKEGDSFKRTTALTISVLAFVFGLLSKTSGVMLPFIMLMLGAWRCGTLRWKDVTQTSPFFAIALAFGALTMWFQKFQALAGETLQPQSFGTRLSQGIQNFFFYLEKALAPFRLNVVYGHGGRGTGFTAVWLLLSLFAIVAAVFFLFGRTRARSLLFGLVCFGVALFPALGFFDAQFVSTLSKSDHLQYLPMVAIIMLGAAGLATVSSAKFFPKFSIGMILGLSLLTFQRARVFGNEESLWRDTLAKNPAASGAHNDLGCLLAEQGKLPEAEQHFVAAVRSDANNWNAHSNLGQVRAGQGKTRAAEKHFQIALKAKPNHGETHRRYAALLTESGRERDAIFQLRSAIGRQPDVEGRIELARLQYKTGDFASAAGQLKRVLTIQAYSGEARDDLASLLATCSEKARESAAPETLSSESHLAPQ